MSPGSAVATGQWAITFCGHPLVIDCRCWQSVVGWSVCLLVCLCRRGHLNPHALASTRPSTYRDVSGECCLVLVERAPVRAPVQIVAVGAASSWAVCYQVCYHPPRTGRMRPSPLHGFGVLAQ